MTVRVTGVNQLQSRLRAIRPTVELHREIALAVLGEQKREAPVRTGNLRRSIRLGTISARVAQTVASANYAAHVEYGTGPHEIRPRRRRALRWRAADGGVVFATKVNHPGTRANPFMARGAELAKRAGIVKDFIVRSWNRAA